MAGRPVKGKRRGNAQVEFPKPGITLDITLPHPGGGVEQLRPTYASFDEAIARLQSLKADWSRQLKRFKADAKK